MTQKAFAFTIKKNVPIEDVTLLKESDFNEQLTLFRSRGSIKACYFETSGKFKHLHCHGVVEWPAGMRYKPLLMKGYSIQIKPVYNLEQWMQYIRKDQKLRETILALSSMFKPTKETPTSYEIPHDTESEEVESLDDDIRMPTKSLFNKKTD